MAPHRLMLAALIALALVAAVPALASPQTSAAPEGSFIKVVAFGDSLSDNANLYEFLQQFSGMTPERWAPDEPGRRSNGRVAVEYLADALGVPLEDYAWSGATTGPNAPPLTPFYIPDMLAQVATYLDHVNGVADPRAVYVVWAGVNDFVTIDPADHPALLEAGHNAVVNIVQAVTELAQAGARHILVVGMLDLGIVPGFPAGFGTLMSSVFNTNLQQGLAEAAPDAHYFDAFALHRDIVEHSVDYGFANVIESCIPLRPASNEVSAKCQAIGPNRYLFWSSPHLTTHAAAIFGRAFANAVLAVTPLAPAP